MAVKVSVLFWIVMPCALIGRHQHAGKINHRHLQARSGVLRSEQFIQDQKTS
jgi:hypothetical protein